VELLSPLVSADRRSVRRHERHTFGRLTLGMMTECSALGASLGALATLPPGWYWYLPPWLSPCHGMLATLTPLSSDVADVGLLPVPARRWISNGFSLGGGGGRANRSSTRQYQRCRTSPLQEPNPPAPASVLLLLPPVPRVDGWMDGWSGPGPSDANGGIDVRRVRDRASLPASARPSRLSCGGSETGAFLSVSCRVVGWGTCGFDCLEVGSG